MSVLPQSSLFTTDYRLCAIADGDRGLSALGLATHLPGREIDLSCGRHHPGFVLEKTGLDARAFRTLGGAAVIYLKTGGRW